MRTFYTSMNLHCSQTRSLREPHYRCFIPLWIYIALKLIFFVFSFHRRFIPLWIYIALKQILEIIRHIDGFIPLWIYIALKQEHKDTAQLAVLYLYEFTLLSNSFINIFANIRVLYLYEFTLLSNLKFWKSSLQLVCKSTSLLYILIQ